LVRYKSSARIPPRFGAQVRSLLCAAGWLGADETDAARPLPDPGLCPTYFLLVEGERLLSYARTIWAAVPHAGRSFKLYGLGDVITRPEFRRHGYGGRVVREATTYIKSDQEADAAVLLTEPKLEAFYGRSGWEYVRELRVATGGGGERGEEATIPMMLFLSARAQGLRAAFTEGVLALPGDEW
jgi:GNAT superfamily N-acetyltransferase